MTNSFCAFESGVLENCSYSGFMVDRMEDVMR